MTPGNDTRGRAVAQVRSGMARHQAGDLAGAVADYTAALALEPQFVEAYNNRGVTRHALGDLGAARADYDAALRINPNYAEGYCNRAATRHALGDLAGTLADSEQALRLRPGYAEAHNNRGAARLALRDLDGALADFDEALRLNPAYVEAYDNRAGAHYLRWEHAEAVADFDRAVALYQTRSAPPAVFCRLHVHRGDARYHAGDSAGLLEDYRRAFQLDAALASQLVVERLAADVRSNLRLVLANCDRHLRDNPGDYIAHSRRGLVWLLMGQDAEADLDFGQVYRKRPQKSGLTELLIVAARRYRDEHGLVEPGEGPAPASAPTR